MTNEKLEIALRYFKACIRRKRKEVMKAVKAESLNFRGIIDAEMSCEIARRYIKRLKAEMS